MEITRQDGRGCPVPFVFAYVWFYASDDRSNSDTIFEAFVHAQDSTSNEVSDNSSTSGATGCYRVRAVSCSAESA